MQITSGGMPKQVQPDFFEVAVLGNHEHHER
jgi:hypothetical protein